MSCWAYMYFKFFNEICNLMINNIIFWQKLRIVSEETTWSIWIKHGTSHPYFRVCSFKFIANDPAIPGLNTSNIQTFFYFKRLKWLKLKMYMIQFFIPYVCSLPYIHLDLNQVLNTCSWEPVVVFVTAFIRWIGYMYKSFKMSMICRLIIIVIIKRKNSNHFFIKSAVTFGCV